MSIYSNTTPKSWSEFASWMRNLKLDGILIEHDYYNDDIVIRNSNTMTIQRASRFMFETMDPELRQETLLQMVANTMKNQHGDITSAVYTPTAVSPIWVTGGGSGGLGFGNVMRGALGAPYMHDMPELEAEYEQKEQELQQDLLKTKLFTPEERQLLTEVKNKVLHMFLHNRLAEERAIPFKSEKMIIAGGCFVSLINEEPINDIDVFFLDDEYNHNLAKGMAKSYESETPVVVHPYTPVVPVMSSNNTIVGHVSLSPKMHLNKHVKIGNKNYMENDQIEQTIFFKDSRMQYITTKYKTREELISHFDFKHCCVSYDFATDKLYITREVFDLIKKKSLVQNGIRRPALWRYEKFHNRGWKEEIMFL
jgi:hypothetical protein